MKSVEKSILLIEDSEPLRKVLSEKLQNSGFIVYEASGGEEGVKLGIEHKPNLVITDLVMFPMDGKALIEKIRQDNNWGKDVAIIALTNSNDDEERDRLKPYNLTDYMIKAESGLDEVVKHVTNLLNGKSKR